jgi:hypothetical protein
VTKTTNREVWEAFDAMGVLVNRPWKDGRIALNLGKTFRRLRQAREEIDEARSSLLAEHAARAEDGGFAKEPDGSIRLKNPVDFNTAWRELLQTEAEVELFPVKTKVVSEAKVQLTAYQYEVLVNLGVLEDGEKAKPEKGDKVQG